MVSSFLGGILGALFTRDPVAERADLAFKFARLVVAVDPIGNLGGSRLIFRLAVYAHNGSYPVAKQQFTYHVCNLDGVPN